MAETDIPPEKVETYRAVCRLERQGATEGERAAAKHAREKLEAKWPGIAEAAGKAADAEQRGAAPPGTAGINWTDLFRHAKEMFGSMQAWLDHIAEDAEQQAQVQEILDDMDVEVKATKKLVVWRFSMAVDDFAEMAEVCGPDLDDDAWRAAAKQFGALAEEAFLNTFESQGK